MRIRVGQMYQNGHVRCGGCLVVEDRCTGGRATQREVGWTYTLPLGWVCRVCALWARPSPEGDTPLQPEDHRSGFLRFSRPALRAARRRRNRQVARGVAHPLSDTWSSSRWVTSCSRTHSILGAPARE